MSESTPEKRGVPLPFVIYLGSVATLLLFFLGCAFVEGVKEQRRLVRSAQTCAPAPSETKQATQLTECTRLLSAASDGREVWVKRARAAEKQLADLAEERASLKPAGAK